MAIDHSIRNRNRELATVYDGHHTETIFYSKAHQLIMTHNQINAWSGISSAMTSLKEVISYRFALQKLPVFVGILVYYALGAVLQLSASSGIGECPGCQIL